MPNPYMEGSESIIEAEHISPDKTGDNIQAKRVALYAWDGTNWQRMPQLNSAASKYTTLIDDTTTTNVTYIGKAVPTGAAIPTSSAVWQITCIDESSSPTTVKYADGDLLFDNTFQSLGSKNYY